MCVALCLGELKWIHKLVVSDTRFTIVLSAVVVVPSCIVLLLVFKQETGLHTLKGARDGG